MEQTITSQGESSRWNWIELYFNLSAMDNHSNITTLKVELFAGSFFAQPISGVVYFDNVCLETSNCKLVSMFPYSCNGVCHAVVV